MNIHAAPHSKFLKFLKLKKVNLYVFLYQNPISFVDYIQRIMITTCLIICLKEQNPRNLPDWLLITASIAVKLHTNCVSITSNLQWMLIGNKCFCNLFFQFSQFLLHSHQYDLINVYVVDWIHHRPQLFCLKLWDISSSFLRYMICKHLDMFGYNIFSCVCNIGVFFAC